jgi:hypothetical protein
MDMTTVILGVLFVVVLLVYLKRRNSRLKAEDDE